MTLPEPATTPERDWNWWSGWKPGSRRGNSAGGVIAAVFIMWIGFFAPGHPGDINDIPIIGPMIHSLSAPQPATAPATTSGYYSVTTQEALYLSALAAAGVPYNDPAATITVGRHIGQLYDQGYSSDQIAYALYGEFAKLGNPYTPAQVQSIVYAGIANFATRRH